MSNHLNRNTNPIRMRNYGRVLQDMIAYACSLEDGDQKKALILYIAQTMRQKNLIWNKDQESGLQRVKEDLGRLSDGKLDCDFPEFEQLQRRAVPQGGNSQMNYGKKKKNK